jgi:hypothetical protein
MPRRRDVDAAGLSSPGEPTASSRPRRPSCELNAGDPGFFTTALFELPVAAALSWSLTPPEIRRIRGALADHAPVVEALDAWWSSRQA